MSAKSTYSKQIFCCPNCHRIQPHYVWSDLVKKLCDSGGCGTILSDKDILKTKKPSVPGIRTDTKNRV